MSIPNLSPHYTKWKPTAITVLKCYLDGKTAVETAKIARVTPTRVTDIASHPNFKAVLENMKEKAVDKARKIFEEHAEAAARRIVTLAEEGKTGDRLRFEASKEILYQIGCKPVEEVRDLTTKTYTPEEIASARKVLLEVENIEMRLGKVRSRFLLNTSPVQDTTIDTSPVQASPATVTTIENTDSKIPSYIYSEAEVSGSMDGLVTSPVPATEPVASPVPSSPDTATPAEPAHELIDVSQVVFLEEGISVYQEPKTQGAVNGIEGNGSTQDTSASGSEDVSEKPVLSV